ncbi:hypothetical protein JCM33374_g2246 [Metschnikowia sp. JCM 33374]|nr:hypothetical protein JCM33374_g2246 [Metschnikowia sp. JCM 33374]
MYQNAAGVNRISEVALLKYPCYAAHTILNAQSIMKAKVPHDILTGDVPLMGNFSRVGKFPLMGNFSSMWTTRLGPHSTNAIVTHFIRHRNSNHARFKASSGSNTHK